MTIAVLFFSVKETGSQLLRAGMIITVKEGWRLLSRLQLHDFQE